MAESAGDIFGPINAETGDVSQFTSTTTNGANTFLADVAAKNEGSYGFHCDFDGSNEQAYGTKDFSEVTEIYTRAYFYLDPITFPAAYDDLIIFNLYDGSTSLVNIRIQGDAGGAIYRWRIYGTELTTTSSTTNWGTGEWHYIEIHWKAGTDNNDGGAQIWIDEASILDEFDNNLAAYAADSIDIGGVLRDAPQSADDFIYVDDIKANTSYIGAYSEEEPPEEGQPAIRRLGGVNHSIGHNLQGFRRW